MSDTDYVTVLPFASPQQAEQQPWVAAEPPQTAVASGIQSAGPVYSFPLVVAQGRVKGFVSVYRTGWITLTEEAVHLQGQAVLPLITRLCILIPLLPGPLLALIVSMILEQVARHPQFNRLAWSDVQEIVLEPAKGRICLVYTEEGKPKPVYSLAFKPGVYYADFVLAARYLAPEKLREGKIGPGTPLWVYIVVLLLIGLSITSIIAIFLQ